MNSCETLDLGIRFGCTTPNSFRIRTPCCTGGGQCSLKISQLSKSGNAAVGYVAVDKNESDWRVHQIHVVPQMRCRGIGTHTLKRIQVDARVAGADVSLSVFRNNRAYSLYERLGFVMYQATELELQLRWNRG
ncbi:GNAT family N-acetyltransferase [Paraburkholderia sp. SIMBA_053]|uniref:GNAT family N-acetyltransferase n=1 Tax=Paraburkholderia sp. SIMBA_053 TaxID=3085794 RepID=UPI00397E1A91